jgi:hypothetical protein
MDRQESIWTTWPRRQTNNKDHRTSTGHWKVCMCHGPRPYPKSQPLQTLLRLLIWFPPKHTSLRVTKYSLIDSFCTMPKPKGGVNQKVAAANDKKAQNEAQVKAKQSAEQEKTASKEWSDGANLRGAKKADDAAAKADEAARKRREKEALLAEEESNMGAGGKPKNKTPVLSKQGKNKKKDDLSLLENALVGAADKKAKAQKLADRQKADEAKRLEQEKALKKEQEKPMDPLLANTEQMLAGTEDDLVGRAANVALGVDGAGSGIDAALGSLNVGGGGVVVTNRKALYMAFEERKMAEIKEEQPGLKMSQYMERVFALWKKSPENPENQVM